MQILLIVLFLVDGQPKVLDGWGPRIQPSMQMCVSRKMLVEEVLKDMSPFPYKVMCVTRTKA